MIQFSNGMKFNTDGPLRVVRRSDGLYVVGQGTLCPVASYEEEEKIIKEDQVDKTT
jgi:hypothetical protein